MKSVASVLRASVPDLRGGGFKITNYSVGLNPLSVAVSDINGDGDLDIITLNSQSNDVSILLGKGDGTFNNALTYKLPTSDQINNALKISSSSAPNTFSVGDINNDSTPDLVIGYLNGAVLIIPFGYDIPKKPLVKQTANLNKLTITGTESGGIVKIYDDTNDITASFISDNNGNYTAIPNAFDGSKKLNIYATVTDTDGNISTPSDVVQLILDTTNPNAPIINSINGSTISLKPTIKGIAESYSVITIYDGLNKIGSPFENSIGVNPATLGFDLGNEVIGPAIYESMYGHPRGYGLSGYQAMKQAGMENAHAGKALDLIQQAGIHARRSMEPYISTLHNPLEPRSRGQGGRLRHSSRHTNIGGSNELMGYYHPPALISQPLSSNYQMQHFLPPQYQAHFYTGGGLYT
jgi:hypothetical protein